MTQHKFLNNMNNITLITVSTATIFFIYLYSMYPNLPGGDTGELLAESCHLGTPHPPGYPLFTILTHVFTRYFPTLPYISNTPATAANFLSCIFGTSCAYFISCTTNILTNNPLGSSISAILFALSPLTWEYSVGAEVFCLNNCLVAMVIFLTVKISSNSSKIPPYPNLFFLGAFVSGLCLSNQHTSLLFLLILVPYVFSLVPSITPKKTFSLAFFFLLGAVFPYCYLVTTSPKEGSWGDFSTLSGLIKHVTREEYGTLKLAPERATQSERPVERIVIYFTELLNQIGYFGGVTAVIGIFLPSQSHPTTPAIKVLLTTHLFYTIIWHVVFSNLPLKLVPMAYEVHSRFWMQPNMLVCIFSGLGVAKLESKLLLLLLWKGKGKGKGKGGKGKGKKTQTQTQPTANRFIFLSLLIAFSIQRNYTFFASNNSNKHFHNYGRSIIDSLPNQSLLISHTDLDWNSVRYLRNCEMQKVEFTHVSAQLLPYPWFQKQIEAGFYPKVAFPPIQPGVSTNKFEEGNAVLISNFLIANLNSGNHKGGVFVDMQAINDAEIESAGAWRHFTLIPHGLVYRVVPRVSDVLLTQQFHEEASERSERAL